MKTPRQVLLAMHRPAEPQLDSLRREVVAQISAPSAPPSRKPKPATAVTGEEAWHAVRRIFRWHFIGLSGAWILIAMLRASGGASEATSPVAAKPAGSHGVIFSLRENRRQILESDNDSGLAAPERGKRMPQSRQGRVRSNQAAIII